MTPALILAISSLVTSITGLVALFVHKNNADAHGGQKPPTVRPPPPASRIPMPPPSSRVP